MKAFVIMPFDDEFTDVYQLFLKPTLEGCGFEVFRADDIRNQRNILQDIVEALATADLIVADLTGGNENVFYELGLAHALNRPVLLLTQDLDDIPFDLQSYRLIQYSTHFAEIGEAKDELAKVGGGYMTGNALFGNPISDFLSHSPENGQRLLQREATGTIPVPPAHDLDTLEGDDERGFLDHLADVEEGYAQLQEIIAEVGDRTEGIGAVTSRRAQDLEAAEGPSHLRKIARGLANELDAYATLLESANDRYDHVASTTDNSLEFMLSFLGRLAADDPTEVRNAVEQQLDALRPMVDAATSGRDAFLDLANTMEATPRIERHLSKSIRAAAKQGHRMADNIERTIASASRAITVGEKVLVDLGMSNGHEENDKE